MNETKLNRRVRFLTFYVVLSNLALAFFILAAFRPSDKKETMDELTVKRINIVDETGKNLRMVISNETRQHPGVMNGVEVPPRERPAGMIFFNSTGDECGGLIYDGNKKEAGFVLSVDKFRDDQVMQLQYNEDVENLARQYGLRLWDYPKENSIAERMKRFDEIQKMKSAEEQQKAYQQMVADSLMMRDRLFLGKTFSKDIGLFIKDESGRPRIRIYIDKNDVPKLEMLDKEGRVIK